MKHILHMRSISKLVASRTPRKTKQYYILTTFSQASKKRLPDNHSWGAKGRKRKRGRHTHVIRSWHQRGTENLMLSLSWCPYRFFVDPPTIIGIFPLHGAFSSFFWESSNSLDPSHGSGSQSLTHLCQVCHASSLPLVHGRHLFLLSLNMLWGCWPPM